MTTHKQIVGASYDDQPLQVYDEGDGEVYLAVLERDYPVGVVRTSNPTLALKLAKTYFTPLENENEHNWRRTCKYLDLQITQEFEGITLTLGDWK